MRAYLTEARADFIKLCHAEELGVNDDTLHASTRAMAEYLAERGYVQHADLCGQAKWIATEAGVDAVMCSPFGSEILAEQGLSEFRCTFNGNFRAYVPGKGQFTVFKNKFGTWDVAQDVAGKPQYINIHAPDAKAAMKYAKTLFANEVAA